MKTALGNITVLDLSRVLAGPYCTQMLGDMGAEIIKIERLGGGDDTRQWGPPYLQDDAGQDTSESAYYLSCNRNKKSIAIDIRTEQGQDLLHKLIEKADILIHNF
ncbi:MAG: CoA transferase, partial [Pseudomonadota bacterium]|nr:CoA transferase [Pseudomonadota bacterium]